MGEKVPGVGGKVPGVGGKVPGMGEKGTRRSFLTKAGVALGGAVALGAGGAEAWSHVFSGGTAAGRSHPEMTTQRHALPSVSASLLGNGMSLPTAAWVAAENARPGTTAWMVGGRPVPHGIEGYASQVSAARGETLSLHVSTTSTTFHVEAYRLGWYGGAGGRLIWSSPEVPGSRQAGPTIAGGTNMVECRWAPSLPVTVGDDWPPGVYLLKLVGSNRQEQWVPLTVRDDVSTAAFCVMNSVTTWQAYNLYGGYSLYFGRNGSGQDYAHRSRVVSFDRPYPLDWANGAADLIGNELPLILLMERHGLDVTYLTDLDLHTDSSLITRHSALLSLGHDEYWSLPMREGATAARDAGVNLAFFGANACYRRIRFQPSFVGANRQEICYKTDYENDPLYGVDDAEVTANWPDHPEPNPESTLIGGMYQSNPVNANLVISEPSSWLYSGTGARRGDSLKGTVGSEYDRYDPSVPSPPNAEILAHSPLSCRGVADHSDVTWYTTPGGGGVFSSGTNWWISKLTDSSQIPPALLPGPFPGVTAEITAMTLNLLSVIGNGPAGLSYPSRANWNDYYSAHYTTPLSAGDKAA